MWAASKDDIIVVDWCLSHGAKVDTQDRCGWTAFHFACNEHHRKEAALALVAYGASGTIETMVYCAND